MTALLRDLSYWLWRLVPANPILVRVVCASSRRDRNVWVRFGYLAVMAGLLMVFVFGTQSQGTASLADLAKGATQTFNLVAVFQLLVVCLLAPIYASQAITQERDAQTYNILLTTPLTNAQIVFGTLLSRMFFVFVLLLAGLPLFSLLMVYGGVGLGEILTATGLAATSALVAGATAIAIAVIRVGTRRTIFLFILLVGLYLMTVYAFAQFPGTDIAEAEPAPGRTERMSWLAAFHPYLALQVALNQTPAPALGAVSHYGFPWSTLAARPVGAYMTMTTLFAVLLCVSSLSFVRASVKEGEPTWFNRIFGRSNAAAEAETDERRRRPRHVWANSIAWREAATRASGPARALQRIGLLIAGILVGGVLLFLYINGTLRTPAEARNWLEAIISIELGLSLLVAANTAATALTREKESGTLDSLLVTPLVSKQILIGKIRGLTWFALPMITVPFVTVLLFVLYDAMSGRNRGAGGPVVFAEALISLPVLLLAFAWCACVLGMQQSVNRLKTVSAVVWSIGILVVVCGVTSGACIGIGGSDANIGAAMMPFSPISAAFVAIDPRGRLGGGSLTPDALQVCRTISFVSAMIAAGVYYALGRYMYAQMVTGFDMTIRKQMT